MPFTALLLLLSAAGSHAPTVDRSNAMETWAKETSDFIESRFRPDGREGYVQSVDAHGRPATQPAFMWDIGVQLSALAACCKLDRKRYVPILDRMLKSMEPYWGVADGVGGFSVLPGLGTPDRFYDDNAWVALALVEAYEATRAKRYLDQSKKVFEFVMSGESADLGGGIFWHEKEKQSKNTCSNAPTIVVALRLYRATKERSYLDIAKRLKQWVSRLEDADGLYWDNQSLGGRIEKTKWTYNTALMIRADCLFFELLHDRTYVESAVKSAEAAVRRWVDPETGAIKDGAAFAHHLFEALLEAARVGKRPALRDAAMKALTFLRDKGRNSLGLYGKGWDGAPGANDKELDLKDEAAACRAFAVAAESAKADSK